MSKKHYVYHKSLGHLVVEKHLSKEEKEDSSNWFFERSWRLWGDKYYGKPYEDVMFDGKGAALDAMTDAVMSVIDALQDDGRVAEVD